MAKREKKKANANLINSIQLIHLINKCIPKYKNNAIVGFVVSNSYCLQTKTFICMSIIASVQFSSVSQSCPTLCDPMNHSTPGLPVHHQLPESTQTHVHLVSDAIQPSHPLLSPSPPAFNLSQHQGLFK